MTILNPIANGNYLSMARKGGGSVLERMTEAARVSGDPSTRRV